MTTGEIVRVLSPYPSNTRVRDWELRDVDEIVEVQKDEELEEILLNFGDKHKRTVLEQHDVGCSCAYCLEKPPDREGVIVQYCEDGSVATKHYGGSDKWAASSIGNALAVLLGLSKSPVDVT